MRNSVGTIGSSFFPWTTGFTAGEGEYLVLFRCNVKGLAVVAGLKYFVYLHKRTLFDVLLIAMVGSVVITWFRGDFLVLSGGFDFYPEW